MMRRCAVAYRYAGTFADSGAGFRVVVSYFGKVGVYQSMRPATPTHPLCLDEGSTAGESTNTARQVTIV